uniref:YdhG-like domain-containing protein n=1 Tax=Caulobacter sp. (strain K31) TaxID=366602 RepID=B0SXG7_CAUSK
MTDPLRLMVWPWFELMRDCGDDVRELVNDGCPVACVGDAPFGYVDAFKAHANIGFFRGAMLADPARLLEGAGKRMRHVKLRPGEALDTDALSDLIAEAYRDIRQRLSLA